VLSEFQGGMGEYPAQGSLNLERWQKIQDLFAGIIGANLLLVNAEGAPLAQPSKVCTYCSDINSSSYTTGKIPDCALKAFQTSQQNQEIMYQCPHSVSYFLVPLKNEKQPGAFIIGGPFLAVKKDTDQDYQQICQNLGIEFESFKDWIRELKLFSHSGVNLVVKFLKELGHFLFSEQDLADKASADQIKARPEILANSLLEIASQIVGADSGSVLLIDSANESFSIQSSRGLSEEILKKKIPLNDGVAGWVVAHKKGVLIGPDIKSIVPKSKLNRPAIKSSMIVPLKCQDQILGVFCLNSKDANERFNQTNLSFLNQLGQIASTGFSGSGLN